MLKGLEYDYDRAAAFDVAMLEALGTVRATIKAEPWPRAIALEGPRLADVLAAAGWNGAKVNAVALDGFAVEITAQDLAAHDWIVAIRGDGEYLGIGGRGPVWIVYDVPGGAGQRRRRGALAVGRVLHPGGIGPDRARRGQGCAFRIAAIALRRGSFTKGTHSTIL